jgi:predicted acylesterase/phospholipase RssA
MSERNKLQEIKQKINDALHSIHPSNEIPLYTGDSKVKEILVLSGGGSRGVGQLGAIKALELRGYMDKIKTIIGSSVGALIGSLYIAGFSPDELVYVVENLQTEKIVKIKWDTILSKYGCDSGLKFVYTFKKLLETKGFDAGITMHEFWLRTGRSLEVMTTQLNPRKNILISHETFPDMTVVEAVRMSASIPLIYTPINKNGSLYVDGCVMDAYPMDVHADQIDKVIGICLVDYSNACNSDSLIKYMTDILVILSEGQKHAQIARFKKWTITINIKSTNMANMSALSKPEIRTMFQQGLIAGLEFINELEFG